MLHVRPAQDADALVGALAELLGERPGDADPFAPDVVAVHSRGIERWLLQRLSHHLGTSPGRGDGVCANVDFPSPGQVVGRALAVADPGTPPDEDPWAPGRVEWPLLEVLEAHLDEEWLGLVRRHLQGDGSPRDRAHRRDRRLGVVRRIAARYDRYAVQRPDLVRDWRGGGAAGAPDHHAWQPRLWRLLRERVGAPSPVERADLAVAALRQGAVPPDLPGRIAIFGITALPAGHVEVLDALAAHRDVHLLLLAPSSALWRRVAATTPLPHPPARPRARARARSENPPGGAARNPLLDSWGRDARELQVVLGGGAWPQPDPAPRDPPLTLLARLQRDVRADRPLPATPDHPLTAGDRSLQVHACHGRLRQVEVLRDAIQHLLADDPTLEPRDVIVLCPDVEAFAPLVEAVFGAGAGAGAGTGDEVEGVPGLRVALADRSLRRTNPVLAVLAQLLELAGGRVTASAVLDLLEREPVRRRFDLDDDEVGRVAAWVPELGIRWGLDAAHRERWGLGGIAGNTWAAGLDRLLVGVAVADDGDRLVGDVVPFDDVEGTDAELAGRAAEFVARVRDVLGRLAGPQPLAAWADALRAAADALTATDDEQRWQQLQVARVLDETLGVGGPAGPLGPGRDAAEGGGVGGVALSLTEVTALLGDRLRGRPSRANHRTGDLTVCTLVPMRSVPHRVVCLLGMDDAAFPRRAVADGDDLVALAPRVGDRDRRTEDRQLLLDAVLAAGEAVVVTYAGRDVRTNAPRPPAVPIGELLDVVDRTARTADGLPARATVVRQHPLQPHAPRAFIGPHPWGFDPAALAAARALAGPRRAAPAFLSGPLPPVPAGETLALADLVAFVEHPVKAFLRQRLDLSPAAEDQPASDHLPVELDGLERWAVRDRALAVARAGGTADRWRAVERRRGTLPPGRAGDDEAGAAVRLAGGLTAAARDALGVTDLAPVETLDVDVALGDGRGLSGTVGLVGDAVLLLTPSTVRAKQRAATWVRLLAASCAAPSRRLRGVVVGCSPLREWEVRVVALAPLDPDAARTALERLAALHREGLRAPLPVFTRTSEAYAAARRAGADPEAARDQAARREWADAWSFPREQSDPSHLLVHDGPVPLEELAPLADGDEEAGRFGVLARHLWDPLLDHEAVSDR